MLGRDCEKKKIMLLEMFSFFLCKFQWSKAKFVKDGMPMAATPFSTNFHHLK